MAGQPPLALAVAVELIGILLIIAGIVVEVATGAGLGHIIISVGSALVAAGSVLWGKLARGGVKAD